MEDIDRIRPRRGGPGGQHTSRRVTAREGCLEPLPFETFARNPGPPEGTHPVMREQVRNSARVIRVGMRHGERIDAQYLPREEEGRHDRGAGVEVAGGKASGVDDQHAAARQLGDRGIALSDVEEGDAEYARAEALVDPPTSVDEEATDGE